MFFPSVLPACNQGNISLLPKTPGKMTSWFHQSLSWTLRWKLRNFGRSGIWAFPSGFSGHDTLHFWLFLYLALHVGVSEREMCLHVFSKQIALIHLFPYQSWQKLQLPGAPDSCSGCEWLAATHLQGTSWVLLGWMLPQCRHLQIPSGCSCTGKQWLQVRQGAKKGGEEHLHRKRGSALGSPAWAAERFIHLLAVLQLHLFRAKSFDSHSGCLRLCKGCSHEKAEISGLGSTISRQTPQSDPKRAQHPRRRHDMPALQTHTFALLILWSEAEDQISILVFLYSKRIFSKWCNQIPSQKNMYKGNK